MEGECVRALGDLDDDRIVRALMRIVLGQFDAQPSCLNAHGGVTLGIESYRSSQDLGGNLILLEGDSRVIERMFSEVPQEFA